MSKVISPKPAAWYNESRVREKGSVVLKQWMETSSPSALKNQSKKANHRAFNAARIDRLTASFMATTTSINNELRSDLDKIRARARHLAKNHDLGKKFTNMVVGNVCGPNGFTLYARSENAPGEQDKFANDAIESAFAKWSAPGVCDITGRMSLTDMVSAICRGMPSDGEFLVRMIKGKAAGNEFNFALQLIDVDRIDTNLNQVRTRNSNAIRMGVEINSFGRPVAVWIFTAHPSDGSHTDRDRERVPMNDLLHKYIVEHAEQYRGIPWMTPGVLTLHHLGEFEQSAILAARKGADTLGFFVTPDGSAPSMDGTDQESGQPIEISVPGQYDTLPDGVDFRPYESKYPDAMLEAFVKNFIRRVSSGWNVSYHSLASDLEGVNYSSIRAGVLEERDAWMAIQRWLIEHLLTPVFMEWLRMSLLSGAITQANGSALPAAKLDKFSKHYWQGRRWAWVDPQKDISAARDGIRSGVLSPQMVAAQNGVDVEDVLTDIARFESAVAAKKITTVSYSEGGAQPPTAQPEPQA